ncbi:MAG: hypothetical protein L0271_07835 [Gemmatimonadetes bacterium]|nr:hypothetical protein [Gemmatimonadota bacterium]
MLNIKVVTSSLGLFGAVTFVVCVVYGLIVPASLHMAQGLVLRGCVNAIRTHDLAALSRRRPEVTRHLRWTVPFALSIAGTDRRHSFAGSRRVPG